MNYQSYKGDAIEKAIGTLQAISGSLDQRYPLLNLSGKVANIQSIFFLERNNNGGELTEAVFNKAISSLKEVSREIENTVLQDEEFDKKDYAKLSDRFNKFYNFIDRARSGPSEVEKNSRLLEEAGRLEGRIKDLQAREVQLSESINVLQQRVERYEVERAALDKELADSLNESKNNNETELKKNSALLEDFYGKEMERLKEKSSDIDVLISVMGGKAISGGFIKNARKEELAAEVFRAIAIVLMIVMAGLLWISIDSQSMKQMELSAAIIKLGFVVFSSFVVAYLVKQSALHRSQQHKYQQKAFDLSGINTYIATLPAADQHALKMKIAEKIFVPPESLMAIETSGFGANELLGKLIDKLEIPGKSKTTP